MFGRRPDAQAIPDVAAMRRIMPFISPDRNGSAVLFSQTVDSEAALAFLERHNATRPEDRPVTFFHLVLYALTLAITERPRLNRFTAGGRLWQRDGFWLTFSAKKALDNDSPMLTIKRQIDPHASLDEMVDGIYDQLGAGRRGKKTTSDKETDLLVRLPPSLIRPLVGFARLADRLGLLPKSMIDADPLFTSVFVANLGSVGLDAAYHHLWNYGTCPIFCVIGRFHEGPDGRMRTELKYTYDERIEDGLYAADGLQGVKERLEHPEKLSG